MRPLNSSTIFFNAVETIVWSNAANSIPVMRPPRMAMISRWVWALADAFRGELVDIRVRLLREDSER